LNPGYAIRAEVWTWRRGTGFSGAGNLRKHGMLSP
jgi:hypothetical protein